MLNKQPIRPVPEFCARLFSTQEVSEEVVLREIQSVSTWSQWCHNKYAIHV